MQEAVIIDAVRTPGGKRNGKLKDWHPASLGAHVLKAIAERNQLDPAIVDDVVMGCVMQVGEQSGQHRAGTAVLAAGWPEVGARRRPSTASAAARASRRCTSPPRV